MSKALEFYDQHKKDTWEIKPIPAHLTDKVEIAKWILLSGFGWLELDVEFDVDAWQKEFEYCKSSLVPHRDTDDEPHLTWDSCCLHGIGPTHTRLWHCYVDDEKDANYHWTELSQFTPTIKQFWEQLPFEQFARIRFMQVGPGGYVSPHYDIDIPDDYDPFVNLMPVNIAVIHPVDCHMVLKDKGTVPWVNGKVMIVNISNYHTVINFANTPRLHMIGHGIPGKFKNEFCDLIIRSYLKQYARSQI
jgi:hypothetical protein